MKFKSHGFAFEFYEQILLLILTERNGFVDRVFCKKIKITFSFTS